MHIPGKSRTIEAVVFDVGETLVDESIEYHNWADWLGGYPYEVASADRLIAFFENLGYRLMKLQAPGHGFGNNQLVFQKEAHA